LTKTELKAKTMPKLATNANEIYKYFTLPWKQIEKQRSRKPKLKISTKKYIYFSLKGVVPYLTI